MLRFLARRREISLANGKSRMACQYLESLLFRKSECGFPTGQNVRVDGLAGACDGVEVHLLVSNLRGHERQISVKPLCRDAGLSIDVTGP